MQNLTTKQQQILDAIVNDFNHDQSLTVQDAAKFESFPNYEIGGQFILNVVDPAKFYQLLAQFLADPTGQMPSLFADSNDPKAAIQTTIQELGAAGQLYQRLGQYGLQIADFSITE